MEPPSRCLLLMTLMAAASASAGPAARRAGDAARAAAAAARIAVVPLVLPCLPLLPAGTLFGAQYSRPSSNASLVNATDALYAQLRAEGASLAQLSLPWADVEKVPGEPDFLLVAEILNEARAAGLVPLVQIAAIDTDRVSVPSDLADAADPSRLRAGLEWNSTALVDRFALLLEVVAPVAANAGAFYFGVGNEVTVNIKEHPETGAAFADFVFVMRSFIHTLTSDAMSVGVTATVGDLAGFAQDGIPAWLALLLDVVDAVPLTYYPIDNNAKVVPLDNGFIAKQLGDALSVLPPAACLIFQEFGAPSGYNNASSVDGSSDAYQAAFVKQFVGLLEAANASRPVRAVSFYSFLDADAATCAAEAQFYNASSSPGFVEYLCTLGLVRDDGTAKPAFGAYLGALRTE